MPANAIDWDRTLLREPLDDPEEELGPLRSMRNGWPALWVVFTNHLLAQFLQGALRFDVYAAWQACFTEGDERRQAYHTARTILQRTEVSKFVERAVRVFRERDIGQHVVTLDETLRTLADVMRTPITDIIDPDTGNINQRKAHLIEKMTVTRRREVSGHGEDKLEWEVEKITVEMMGKMDALKTNARLRGYDPTAKGMLLPPLDNTQPEPQAKSAAEVLMEKANASPMFRSALIQMLQDEGALPGLQRQLESSPGTGPEPAEHAAE